MTSRPDLTVDLGEAEFRRWYYTVVELRAGARLVGVSPSGTKQDLTERIGARLGGRDGVETPAGRNVTRRSVSRPLAEPITDDTVLGPRQALTRQLRDSLAHRIPGFHADAVMRDFIGSDREKTVGEVVAHWHASRGLPPPPTGAQFEWNRFARAWFAANPGGSAKQCRAAWRAHRELPRDERPPT